jgi:hypothetical protein
LLDQCSKNAAIVRARDQGQWSSVRKLRDFF